MSTAHPIVGHAVYAPNRPTIDQIYQQNPHDPRVQVALSKGGYKIEGGHIVYDDGHNFLTRFFASDRWADIVKSGVTAGAGAAVLGHDWSGGNNSGSASGDTAGSASGGSPEPGDYDFTGPSQTPAPGDYDFTGPAQGGSGGVGSGLQDWAKKNLNAAGETGKVAKAILALGAAYLGHEASNSAGANNVPPEITSMLKLSSDRANYQNPLFQAATQGTYQMLPTFARQGTSMPTGPLPDRRVP